MEISSSNISNVSEVQMLGINKRQMSENSDFGSIMNQEMQKVSSGRPEPPQEMMNLRSQLSDEGRQEMDNFMSEMSQKIQSGDFNKNEIMASMPDEMKQLAKENGIDLEKRMKRMGSPPNMGGGMTALSNSYDTTGAILDLIG